MGSARITYSLMLLGGMGLTLVLSASASPWQEAGQQQAGASRLVGAITAISGKSLTVKPDSGAPSTVTVSDSAHILQTAPGAKTLAGATPIQFTDLAVGDRVLVAVHSGADGSPTATTVVALKQAAIAQAQQADQADWQRRGVGGLVKSVDATSGTITIAAGSRTYTIHVTPKTIVRRYDPESIKFSDAKPSTLAQINTGDQLRARGDRGADGSEVTADEIVAGAFRNIAGTVVSSDASANTVTVTDLATKKPVVIHIAADSQLHKLPPEMAQMLAARFKSGGQRPQGAPSTPPAGAAAEGGQGGSHVGGSRNGDLSQSLQRTPALQLSELHKGDAVMIVATQGTSDAATAVTLIAGVEPILTSSASQNMFSASWNLGGGGEGEGTQ